MLRAANSIAESKQADQPAAKSCSGLVPVPGPPGRDSLTSRRPSELRDTPMRPPVLCAFAVYSTFSSRFITSSFMMISRTRRLAKLGGVRRSCLAWQRNVVGRPQIRELGEQIDVGSNLVPCHLPVCENRQEGVGGVVGKRTAVSWKRCGTR